MITLCSSPVSLLDDIRAEPEWIMKIAIMQNQKALIRWQLASLQKELTDAVMKVVREDMGS